MASKRKIDAYRKRLAKISSKRLPAHHLTADCIGAVVSYWELGDHEVRHGTLTGFAYRMGVGLLGPRLMVDITVCTACVHQRGGSACEASEITIVDAAISDIRRNGDGHVEEAA
jgi:hypothetical protein